MLTRVMCHGRQAVAVMVCASDAGPGRLSVVIVRNDVTFFKQGVTQRELFVKLNNRDELLHMKPT